MVDDVGELVGVEAEVERVEDAAHERDAEVGLEVRAVVPAERGDAVAGLDAEVEQGPGEAAGAVGEVGEGVAVDRLVGEAPDDFLAAGRLFGAAEDRRQRQRDSPSSGRSCGGLYAERGRGREWERATHRGRRFAARQGA